MQETEPKRDELIVDSVQLTVVVSLRDGFEKVVEKATPTFPYRAVRRAANLI